MARARALMTASPRASMRIRRAGGSSARRNGPPWASMFRCSRPWRAPGGGPAGGWILWGSRRFLRRNTAVKVSLTHDEANAAMSTRIVWPFRVKVRVRPSRNSPCRRLFHDQPSREARATHVEAHQVDAARGTVAAGDGSGPPQRPAACVALAVLAPDD